MKEIPVAIKRSIELLGIFTAGVILFIGKTIIMPLLMAFFIGLMLMPVFRFFRRKGIPEMLAILLAILSLTVSASLVGWLFYDQVSSMVDDLPVVQKNITALLNNLSAWISKVFGLSSVEQQSLIDRNSGRFFSFAETAFKQAASSLSGTIIFFGLLPVYVFFVLWYRNVFVRFILMWNKTEAHEKVLMAIKRVERVVKGYLFGLLIQFTYIVILLGGILTLVGIPHGLLIGILFAFLNLIPYLGPLIGNILAILITLASSGSFKDVLIVFGIITLVQFLDNNILMPRIVGSQVKINALVSIVGIFTGGALAGITGMFLAMPIIAVMKALFDHSVNFQKWGVLLGDDRKMHRIPESGAITDRQ
ncbi:MAG: AI-2E family transporter [Bacteroidota bacterium]|nr:AI-2E family transporter [Bacteroidota bacterium]MDP4247333.1 AI-2E family transporter [Bacteroidota bacterium]MDP4255084.1 AI-2E family transporter [Bacteroidota bacterium]MDP4260416.1 AI-2E family transporter [Bacteroidota bacterium]